MGIYHTQSQKIKTKNYFLQRRSQCFTCNGNILQLYKKFKFSYINNNEQVSYNVAK